VKLPDIPYTDFFPPRLSPETLDDEDDDDDDDDDAPPPDCEFVP
jgi:hypothetical protein